MPCGRAGGQAGSAPPGRAGVGAAPGDLMAILEALRQAGALRGELVII